LAKAAAAARARAAAVQQELGPARGVLAQAQRELGRARRRQEAARQELEAIQYGAPGSPGRGLERFSCQWALALLAGGLGLLGLLGPQVLFRAFLALAGSAVGGLLLACSVGYVASSLGLLDVGRGGLLGPLQLLLYGSSFSLGVWLWVLALSLGTMRWCLGFECAIYAIVDEDLCQLSGSEEEGVEEYLLDNSVLNSQANFLSYRFSKRMEDKDEDLLAAYGSTVRGLDEGDGWLRVGGRYLPMEVRGVPVLILQPRELPAAQPCSNGAAGEGAEAVLEERCEGSEQGKAACCVPGDHPSVIEAAETSASGPRSPRSREGEACEGRAWGEG